MANELTPSQLKEKIEQVRKDIEVVRTTADANHKIDIMYQYLEYLEDELKEAQKKR